MQLLTGGKERPPERPTVTDVIDRDTMRQRLVQNFKARLMDGSLLILLAMLLVLIASTSRGF